MGYIKRIWVFVLAAFFFCPLVKAEDKRVDCWFETAEIFGSSASGSIIEEGRGQRFSIDYQNRKAGDLSVVYTSDSVQEKEIGFMVPSYSDYWDAGPEWELHISMKSTHSEPTRWAVSIVDTNGGKALSEMESITTNSWKEVVFNSGQFKPSYTKFDETKLKTFQIRARLPQGKKLWFDDIYFKKKNGETLGVMEKSIDRRMAEAEQTREARIEAAMRRAQTKSPSSVLNAYFAKLYLDRQTESINQKLYIIFTTKNSAVRKQFGINQPWNPYLDSMLFRFWFTFNRTNGKYKRLTSETQNALLDLIWERNRRRNDINLAERSSWDIVNSESLDLCFKSAALLSSQIFKNRMAYESKEYFDSGKGGGAGYWFHMNGDIKTFGPEGRAEPKDRNTGNSEEHYNAWAEFFKKYIKERADKGFFIANASPVYSKYTINYIYDIHDYCEDKELRDLCGKFLDLYWADWLQDCIAGYRGGVKIKDYAELDARVDSTHLMLQYHLGGGGTAEIITINQLLSDYRLPEVLWDMALDRRSLGEFEYISRRPGEEENKRPRPLGDERTFLCDKESRIVRYSWVTPDYVMASRMTHPSAVMNHLSAAPMWHGVQFNTSPQAMVTPRAINIKDDTSWNLYKESGYFRSVQHKNVMITQQARSYITVNPAWFLEEKNNDLPIGIHFGEKPDRMVEKQGWIFIEQGNSFLAVRPVRSYYEAGGEFDYLEGPHGLESKLENRSYEWNSLENIAKLKSSHSPIIFETARKSNYSNLTKFIQHIDMAEIKLVNGIVPEAYSVVYTTTDISGKEIKLYLNAANNEMPKINGEYLDYEPDKLFDSPYMQSLYDSGVTNIMCGGRDLTLSF
ncbi:hypothetical protein [Sedimentisphaera salicampi]|uniref:hypothetical protein n=1 Tax=Sedimentisphaera salicampi TaxID=1941349 RepID=UPI000B9B080E|nr:hypothetical protein [Sedimentisphaera salicampi]OXU15220.1 hypothetical protein SMSP1_01024 [Sedimentisphaera salicampi]